MGVWDTFKNELWF